MCFAGKVCLAGVDGFRLFIWKSDLGSRSVCGEEGSVGEPRMEVPLGGQQVCWKQVVCHSLTESCVFKVRMSCRGMSCQKKKKKIKLSGLYHHIPIADVTTLLTEQIFPIYIPVRQGLV